MATENKTKPTDTDVVAFIQQIENKRRSEDGLLLLEMYNRITGLTPKMWGSSIIGYGTYTYTLASGKKEQFMRCGFSPRKQNLSLYVGVGIAQHPKLLEQLGKHKTSKACLYINKLADVDVDVEVLEQIIKLDLEAMNARYPE